MMRHSITPREVLRQTGWLLFAGSTDARRAAVRDPIGGDRT